MLISPIKQLFINAGIENYNDILNEKRRLGKLVQNA